MAILIFPSEVVILPTIVVFASLPLLFVMLILPTLAVTLPFIFVFPEPLFVTVIFPLFVLSIFASICKLLPAAALVIVIPFSALSLVFLIIVGSPSESNILKFPFWFEIIIEPEVVVVISSTVTDNTSLIILPAISEEFPLFVMVISPPLLFIFFSIRNCAFSFVFVRVTFPPLLFMFPPDSSKKTPALDISVLPFLLVILPPI